MTNATLSVIHYEPGHGKFTAAAKAGIAAARKNGSCKISTYKEVGAKGGTAVIVHHGDGKAPIASNKGALPQVNSAEEWGVNGGASFDVLMSHSGNNGSPSPYVVAIEVNYDESKAEDVKRAGNSIRSKLKGKHAIITHPGKKGQFVVAIPCDSPDALDKKSVDADALKEFCGQVSSMNAVTLELVKEFSHH